MVIKQRRRSGRVYPSCLIPQKELLNNNIFLQSFWDDWEDHRDGYREWMTDGDKIKKEKELRKQHSNHPDIEKVIRRSKKQRRKEKIREAMKHGRSSQFF